MSAAIDVREDGRTVVAVFPGSWLNVEHGEPKRIAQVLREHPAAAFVVNGPMFRGGGTPRFLLLDRDDGVAASSDEVGEGVTVWSDGVRAHGLYGGTAPASATVAVQGWPSLVVDSEVTASNVGTNAERVWRPGIGVTADGRVIVVALIGTMVDLARRMLREGAVMAGYLDGGSSLQLEGGGVLRESPDVAPVPTWVIAEPPPAASRARWGWALGAACVAAIGYVAWEATRGRPEGLAPRANPGAPTRLFRTSRSRNPNTVGAFWTPDESYARYIHDMWPLHTATLSPGAVVRAYAGSPNRGILHWAKAEGAQVASFRAWDWDTDELVVLDPSVLSDVRRADAVSAPSPSARRAGRGAG